MRRLILALAVLFLIPVLLVTGSLWADDGFWHEGIESVGLVLILLCMLGRAACTFYIGGRKSEELVSIGPYSLCRNPLYVCSLLGTIGTGFLFGSLAMGAFFGLVCFVAFDRLIRREERFLASRFPADFPAYCAATPRWQPRFSAWQGVDEILVRPGLVYRTLRDASVFVLMFPLFEAIEGLQQIGVLPIFIRLP